MSPQKFYGYLLLFTGILSLLIYTILSISFHLFNYYFTILLILVSFFVITLGLLLKSTPDPMSLEEVEQEIIKEMKSLD
ncbi:hypothetical protein IC006_2209 [Sulfuracidifex tepidarius]|uniref:Uncharacterized protein n=1 Tax=Sulfuracidifex tepidarius TaxID=1294262 RepID=A0A510DXE0_9CREN|nr:hypothetical protein IC006_2209 [Sulfuracidifex tepidarius]BBG27660.1 hypothetical protein IC007_2214 [Sulfuracidifex tepidarius]